MLSDRRQQVLSALIQEYIAHALPVGSRTLVERYQLGVSPATVRNELSILEDAGYIVQPHTSAGRIPTDFGYRTFVDELLKSDRFTESLPDDGVIEDLKQSASRLDDLMEQTSAALARLTDNLSIVLAPSVLALQIKQISLISLTAHRFLIVIVTEDGKVLNRSVEFYEEVAVSDLAAVQNTLNEVLVGKPASDIEKNVSPYAEASYDDGLMRVILEEVLICVHENDLGRTHRLGLSTLLSKPEFSDSQTLLPIIEMLEDDEVLLHILDSTAAQDTETVVKIGRENNDEALTGVSVVATQFGHGDAEGIVAVIGPTRMDYSKVIQAVRLARKTLQGS